MASGSSMPGGDEIGAVVVDVGSWAVRTGYSGDDTPRRVWPSAYGLGDPPEENGAAPMDTGAAGPPQPPPSAPKRQRPRFVGDHLTRAPMASTEVCNLFSEKSAGLYEIDDWDAFQHIIRGAIADGLQYDVAKHPVLIVEPAIRLSNDTRTKAAEHLFEGIGVPATFLARGAVMTAFASARSTALVVDAGAQGVSVSPVHEGYILERPSMSSPVGGHFLRARMAELAQTKLAQGSTIKMPHEVLRKIQSDGKLTYTPVTVTGKSENHAAFFRGRLLDEMKHSVCRLELATPADEREGEDQDKDWPGEDRPSRFELPDGNVIALSLMESESIPELLFNPPADFTSAPGMAQMAFDAASACDADVRRELFGGVVLTGGTSLLPGVTERFQQDLALLTPQMFKTKLIAAQSSVERTSTPWVGGSILSSLGTFHQMWMSKQEYDEIGGNGILRRCP